MKALIRIHNAGMIAIVALECTAGIKLSGPTQQCAADSEANTRFARVIMNAKTISFAGIQTKSIAKVVERHVCPNIHKKTEKLLDGNQ